MAYNNLPRVSNTLTRYVSFDFHSVVPIVDIDILKRDIKVHFIILLPKLWRRLHDGR
jgi:hypothetical protein